MNHAKLLFSVLIAATVILWCSFNFADASSASDETEEDPIKFLEKEAPIYTHIYRLKGEGFSDEDEYILNTYIRNGHSVDTFPHIHSALHRAIEKMNAGAIQWLLTKGARVDYGLNPKDGTILSERDRAGKPETLVAYLESNINPTNRFYAADIMELLGEINVQIKSKDKNGIETIKEIPYSQIICEWKAQDYQFILEREKWASRAGIDLSDLMLHPATEIQSLGGSANTSEVGSDAENESSSDEDEKEKGHDNEI